MAIPSYYIPPWLTAAGNMGRMYGELGMQSRELSDREQEKAARQNISQQEMGLRQAEGAREQQRFQTEVQQAAAKWAAQQKYQKTAAALAKQFPPGSPEYNNGMIAATMEYLGSMGSVGGPAFASALRDLAPPKPATPLQDSQIDLNEARATSLLTPKEETDLQKAQAELARARANALQNPTPQTETALQTANRQLAEARTEAIKSAQKREMITEKTPATPAVPGSPGTPAGTGLFGTGLFAKPAVPTVPAIPASPAVTKRYSVPANGQLPAFAPRPGTNAAPSETNQVSRYSTEEDARADGHKAGDIIYLEGVGKVRLK